VVRAHPTVPAALNCPAVHQFVYVRKLIVRLETSTICRYGKGNRMTTPDGRKGRGPSLPGQPTEEAVAEVGSEAGKSLIRGLQKLGNAAAGEWVASREAKAEAARLAITTDAKIKNDQALDVARRTYEVAELDHQAVLRRRADRLRHELAREQLNLEAIERRAIELTEADASNKAARELDNDWLFRFADLAQKVSDSDVQELWARALSSAAVEGASKLSAASLQMLGLFDNQTAQHFRRFVAVVRALNGVPRAHIPAKEPQDIDLDWLREFGLIAVTSMDGSYRMLGAKLGVDLNRPEPLFSTCFHYTQRGYEIAKAVFRNENSLSISPEMRIMYAKIILNDALHIASTSIIPLGEDGKELDERFVLSKNRENGQADWRSSPLLSKLQPELVNVLEWADQEYCVSVKKARA
jgi:hypothetical protein